MNLPQERLDILTAAAEGREREVMHHQINIDNYARAIAEIEGAHADDADLGAFAAQLRELLASSHRDQAKERILLKVLREQLACTSA